MIILLYTALVKFANILDILHEETGLNMEEALKKLIIFLKTKRKTVFYRVVTDAFSNVIIISSEKIYQSIFQIHAPKKKKTKCYDLM